MQSTTRNNTAIGFKPAVGYLRRSTDRQEQSILDQKKTIEAYAITTGYELLDFYVDDAISGASAEGRASFLKLIEDAKRQDCPFQFVLVYDVKRFGRVDNDEAGYYRYQLRRNGIEVIYVSEGFNGDDTDDLLRPVKQWQARQELKDLSKVTIRGLVSRSEGGWWMGGTPPYGYDLVYYSGSGDFLCVVRFMPDWSRHMYDDKGNLIRTIPHGDSLNFAKKDRCRLVLSSDDRVEIIKNLFGWYVIEGLGFKGIADRLNRNRTPSPRKGSKCSGVGHPCRGWGSTTIMAILKNPLYTGDMVWNRRTGAKFYRISDKKATPRKIRPGSEYQPNGQEEWIVSQGSHPAIITHDRFNQAQAKIKATARYGYAGSYRCGKGAHSPYLLTGLIKCSSCGHNWTGYRTIKGRKRKDGTNPVNFYYVCNGYLSKGTSICHRRVIGKEQLEAWVMEVIGEMIAQYLTPENLDYLQKLVEVELQHLLKDSGNKLEQVESRQTELEKTITNLIDNITEVNREFVDKRLIELKRELIDLEKRRQELQAQGHRRVEIEKVMAEAMAMARDYRLVSDQGSVEEKRFFLRAFLKSIVLDPERAEGEARFVLLPGLDKLWQPSNTIGKIDVGPAQYGPAQFGPALSAENLPLLAQKNSEAQAMSSELLVAGAGFEPATFGL